MLRDSVVVADVVRMRPRAMLLVMTTMRKSTHRFPFLSFMSMGLRLVALRAAGAPLIHGLAFFLMLTKNTCESIRVYYLKCYII